MTIFNHMRLGMAAAITILLMASCSDQEEFPVRDNSEEVKK